MTALSDGLLDLRNRPGWYYTRAVAGLSACATLAGGLQIVGSGDATIETVVASGLSAGLTTIVIAGTVSLWAAEQWRIERLRRIPIPGQLLNLSNQPPPPVIKYVDKRAYAADTAAYHPGFVVLPNPRGNQGDMLHVTEDQLRILQRRIRSNNLSLPINGLDGFSSSQAKALRIEVVRLGLGEEHGNNNQMVRWTGEGAVRVLRCRPSEPIPGLK